ncbi:hypothetical protein BD413DRAFT_600460 [Trametes elegans]|nr:hypothetical protein BD413DRAFT_600460 [Trametes elegans]
MIPGYTSFDVSEERSLLPWLDESSTAPLLNAQADESEGLIYLDSPVCPIAPPGLPPKIAACASSTSPCEFPAVSLAPPPAHFGSLVASEALRNKSKDCTTTLDIPVRASPFSIAPPRDVEAELRATVDALLKRKRAAQRGAIEENAALHEEVAFLRNTIRLSGPSRSLGADSEDGASGASHAELAAALEQERTQRLRSEEKLRALVDYLAEQIASVSECRSVAEKALRTVEQDRGMWQSKNAAAMARCEALEDENLKVKSLLALLARQAPVVVQQQIQSMLREVAAERANLKRMEAVEQYMEKPTVAKPDRDLKFGTLHV